MEKSVITKPAVTGKKSIGNGKTTKAQTDVNRKAFDEKVAKMENEEFKRNVFEYVLFVLQFFTNREHRLSIRQISLLVNSMFPEYGETPKNREKHLSEIASVENNRKLTKEQKEEMLTQIYRKHAENRLNSTIRTVSNQLNHYFKFVNDIISIKKESDSLGESFSEQSDTLEFLRNIKLFMMKGRIRKARSKALKCNVYWFEPSSKKWTPSNTILQRSGKENLPFPTRETEYYDDCLDMEDLRYFLSNLYNKQ